MMFERDGMELCLLPKRMHSRMPRAPRGSESPTLVGRSQAPKGSLVRQRTVRVMELVPWLVHSSHLQLWGKGITRGGTISLSSL